MLTFLNLGKKGNLGNQMFQISSVMGLAIKNNHHYCFPKWQYSDFFQHKMLEVSNSHSFTRIQERKFEYHNWELGEGNFDLSGWLQSEKYFDIEKTKEIFSFEQQFLNDVLDRNKFLFDKKNILISVRRGDFVNHPYFYQITYKYYFLAITELFPDWKSRNLIFTSDDIDYCKRHFSFFKHAIFLEGHSPMEQLAIGTVCDDFIISNSTFSWWIAWLGEKENSKVVRPLKNFRGQFGKKNNEKDYFPERWIVFNEKERRISIQYLNIIVKGEFYRIINFVKHFFRSKYRILMKTAKKIIKSILKID